VRKVELRYTQRGRGDRQARRSGKRVGAEQRDDDLSSDTHELGGGMALQSRQKREDVHHVDSNVKVSDIVTGEARREGSNHDPAASIGGGSGWKFKGQKCGGRRKRTF